MGSNDILLVRKSHETQILDYHSSDMDTPKKMVALQDSPSFQFIKSRFELYVST